MKTTIVAAPIRGHGVLLASDAAGLELEITPDEAVRLAGELMAAARACRVDAIFRAQAVDTGRRDEQSVYSARDGYVGQADE